MPCNCGSGNKQSKYIYTDASGREFVFATEVEAMAAKVRAGGAGSIRSVSR